MILSELNWKNWLDVLIRASAQNSIFLLIMLSKRWQMNEVITHRLHLNKPHHLMMNYASSSKSREFRERLGWGTRISLSYWRWWKRWWSSSGINTGMLLVVLVSLSGTLFCCYLYLICCCVYIFDFVTKCDILIIFFKSNRKISFFNKIKNMY